MQAIDAGHFWALPGDSESSSKLSQLMSDINDYNREPLQVSNSSISPATRGQLYKRLVNFNYS